MNYNAIMTNNTLNTYNPLRVSILNRLTFNTNMAYKILKTYNSSMAYNTL